MFSVPQSSVIGNSLITMNPQPEILIFSSEAARQAHRRRTLYPVIYKILDVICEIIKCIFRIILFIPFGLLWVLGKICQNCLLPAAGGLFTEQLCFAKKILQESFRCYVDDWLESGYASSVKRIPIQCDDLLIDAISIQFPDAEKDRWMLVSLGNSECFETRAMVYSRDDWILNVAKQARANVVVFNYPGVMHSKGPITRESLGKAYQACVHYLRDHPDGPKAKQIIAYGYSLGTLVQALGLSKEVVDGSDGVDWFVIKDRGPRSVAAIASQWLGKVAGWTATQLGWEINSAKYSESLVCPELFIHGEDYQAQLIGDGMFNRDNCFAAPFLDPNAPKFPGKKIPVGEFLLRHEGELDETTIQNVVKHIIDHYGPEDPSETPDDGE